MEENSIGIPKVYWYGEEAQYHILVMELLNENIEEMFNRKVKREFNLMTILLMTDQMLCRLKAIHDKGIIHRDVKPENFLIKKIPIISSNKDLMNKSKPHEIQREYQQTIYLVDFGLSKAYRNPITGKHVECFQKQHFVGTAGYSSLNSHRLLGNHLYFYENLIFCTFFFSINDEQQNYLEQSRRDDLESLSNIMVYFCKGKLPWQGLQGGKDKIEKYTLITEKKFNTSVEELCEGLPIEFALFCSYCRGLEFDQRPDYGGDIQNYDSRIDPVKSKSIARSNNRPRTLMFGKFSSQTRKSYEDNLQLRGIISQVKIQEQKVLNQKLNLSSQRKSVQNEKDNNFSAQNQMQNVIQLSLNKKNKKSGGLLGFGSLNQLSTENILANSNGNNTASHQKRSLLSVGNNSDLFKQILLKSTNQQNQVQRDLLVNHNKSNSQSNPLLLLNKANRQLSTSSIDSSQPALKIGLINKLRNCDDDQNQQISLKNVQEQSLKQNTPKKIKKQSAFQNYDKNQQNFSQSNSIEKLNTLENQMSAKQLKSTEIISTFQSSQQTSINRFVDRRRTESYSNHIIKMELIEQKYIHADTIKEEETKTPKVEPLLKRLKTGSRGTSKRNNFGLVNRLNESAGTLTESTKKKKILHSTFKSIIKKQEEINIQQ
eukprot:403336441